MPKDTKTLGNNKARACESLGFVHKKRLCQRFDTTSFFTFGRDRPIYRLCGIRTLARAFENNTPDGQYEIFAPKNRKVCFPADFSTHNL